MNFDWSLVKNYLDGLKPRERALVIGGAAVLLVLILYLLIWEPVANSVEEKRSSVAQQEELLQWMRKAAQEINQLQAGGGGRTIAGAGQSLLSLIDSTAKAAGLGGALKRVQPDGQNENGARVWLEQVGFDDMVKWLDQLQKSYGVQVTGSVIDRQEAVGLVNARLELMGAS